LRASVRAYKGLLGRFGTTGTPQHYEALTGRCVGLAMCNCQFGQGKKVCHCGECCQTFRSLSGFDLHRQGSYGKHNDRHCESPVVLGMAADERGHWGLPREEDDVAPFWRKR
jgi:hypothetical protein